MTLCEADITTKPQQIQKNTIVILKSSRKIGEERDQVRNFQPPTGEEIMLLFNLKPSNKILKEAIKEAILEGEILMNIKRLMTSC
jgi:hypothetical protein